MIKLVILTSFPNGLLLLKSIAACLPENFTIAGVIVCADKRNPHFFGQNQEEDPVAQYCKEKGLDLYFNPNEIKGKTFDLGLSFSNFFILNEEHICCFNHGVINFHGAPINRYRGSASTVFHILKQENHQFGYSYHFMTPELDKGHILHEHTFDYSDELSSKDLDQMVLHTAINKIPLLMQDIAKFFKEKMELPSVREGVMPKKRSELEGLEVYDLSIEDSHLKVLMKAFDWPQIVKHPQILVNHSPVRLVPEETYQEMLEAFRKRKPQHLT